MFEDFLGERIKVVRDDIYKLKQTQFCIALNKYIDSCNESSEREKLYFNQALISLLEKKNQISKSRLSVILNFLYETKSINPAWIMIKNNQDISLYLVFSKNNSLLIDKQKQLIESGKNINKAIAALDIEVQKTINKS